MGRLRALLDGPESVLLVLVMLLGCLCLWIGIPIGWLWVGSQVEGSSSLGIALMVTMTGSVVSIILLVMGLARLNRRHAALQERRNRPVGETSALEAMLVTSAGIAVVGFAIWFLVFAGTSPAPVNISF